jgi:hypothetical protein
VVAPLPNRGDREGIEAGRRKRIIQNVDKAQEFSDLHRGNGTWAGLGGRTKSTTKAAGENREEKSIKESPGHNHTGVKEQGACVCVCVCDVLR